MPHLLNYLYRRLLQQTTWLKSGRRLLCKNESTGRRRGYICLLLHPSSYRYTVFSVDEGVCSSAGISLEVIICTGSLFGLAIALRFLQKKYPSRPHAASRQKPPTAIPAIAPGARADFESDCGDDDGTPAAIDDDVGLDIAEDTVDRIDEGVAVDDDDIVLDVART